MSIVNGKLHILGHRLSEGSVVPSWAIADDVWSRVEETPWATHAA